jgi:hypothetical protein
MVLGFKLILARKSFSHWNHASKPFLLYFIFQIVSHSLSPGPAWTWFSYLCLLFSWDHICTPPLPAYLLRLSLANFLPRLASNCNLHYLFLSSSWGYRCETLHWGIGLHFLLPIPHLFLYSFYCSHKNVSPSLKFLSSL